MGQSLPRSAQVRAPPHPVLPRIAEVNAHTCIGWGVKRASTVELKAPAIVLALLTVMVWTKDYRAGIRALQVSLVHALGQRR